MRSIYKYGIAITTILLFMVGCSKDGTIITAKEAASTTLTASSNSLTLLKANAEDTAITFNWALADFGYNAAITETMQLCLAGNNFADSIVVTLDPNQVRKAFTVADFNTLINKLNLPFDQSSQIEVRIKSTISDSYPTSYSNVETLTVLPYASISWLYVPGAYQGWDPVSADSLISATGNNVYTGIINFDAANSEFKLTPAKNWNTSYGDGGTDKLSAGGGNLKSPGAGSYQIIANLNDMSIEMAYFQWSIIGDATAGGWSTDTDMKYNNGDSTWSLTTVLSVGTMKFRKNHDWGTNYGGSGGTIASGGDNIPITEAGTYQIKLDIPNQKYVITKQ